MTAKPFLSQLRVRGRQATLAQLPFVALWGGPGYPVGWRDVRKCTSRPTLCHYQNRYRTRGRFAVDTKIGLSMFTRPRRMSNDASCKTTTYGSAEPRDRTLHMQRYPSSDPRIIASCPITNWECGMRDVTCCYGRELFVFASLFFIRTHSMSK